MSENRHNDGTFGKEHNGIKMGEMFGGVYHSTDEQRKAGVQSWDTYLSADQKMQKFRNPNATPVSPRLSDFFLLFLIGLVVICCFWSFNAIKSVANNFSDNHSAPLQSLNIPENINFPALPENMSKGWSKQIFEPSVKDFLPQKTIKQMWQACGNCARPSTQTMLKYASNVVPEKQQSYLQVICSEAGNWPYFVTLNQAKLSVSAQGCHIDNYSQMQEHLTTIDKQNQTDSISAKWYGVAKALALVALTLGMLILLFKRIRAH